MGRSLSPIDYEKNSLFLSRTFVLIIKPTNPLLPPTTARSLLHPTNVAYGLNLSKTIHYTHAPLVYYYICRKKYLSICRNPLFIHNISLPNQYTSANSDFPAMSLKSILVFPILSWGSVLHICVCVVCV